MKIIFLILFFSNIVQAATIKAGLSLSNKKAENRQNLLKEVQVTLGQKQKLYDDGQLSFYATITEFKEKLPEMPAGVPVMIYGEVYQNNKIVGHPQVLTLLGREATFTMDDSEKNIHFELKFKPTLIEKTGQL